MKKNHLFCVMATFALILMSCSESTESNLETGRLNVRMTDAPFPFDLVAEANVTVFKIDARLKDQVSDNESDEESSSSPYIVLMEDEVPLNLLELTNGTTADMANLDVPVGTYDLVRVYVRGINVVLTDGTVYDLKVPSGSQSGIKVFIKPGLTVVGGLSSDLLLDFDVSRSFVAKGNSKRVGGITGFNFKPVIKASNMSTAGTLYGNVSTLIEDATNPLEGAQVTVFNETDTTATFTDIEGNYMLMGLTAGGYKTVSELNGYKTSDSLAISIAAGNKTVQDFVLELDMESTEEGN